MQNRVFRYLTIASLLFFALVMMLAIPSFLDPEFEVINHSPGVVSVVAGWRNSEKPLGNIQPESSSTFSLDDEAAITFTVTYGDGKVVESKPLYFTSGIKVIANITGEGVEVRYDFE